LGRSLETTYTLTCFFVVDRGFGSIASPTRNILVRLDIAADNSDLYRSRDTGREVDL